ncbi:DUF6415 family natural product biosynthesis protein [Streptomyces sp. NPDC057555]|uniref:DUF6415 family natural product biosynthesis protein n=1 Tax=Streptomyces sp. NPDC057555 TaxID=3346166 RepID=UPI0036C025B0
MAALTAPAAGKAEILLLVEAVLAWGPQALLAPSRDEAHYTVGKFTAHGRLIAGQLRALLHNSPADPHIAVRARAALGEADRRLPLPPPITQQQAVLRAQNLGRLIKALYRAVDLLVDEEARTAGRHTSGPGHPAKEYT